MGPTTAVGEDFDGFYAAHFRDTVALTYTLTADMVEAQDIAQEAFCRAWRRWTHIRGYENPVAWVRRVAINLARSRWRRLRTASLRLAAWHSQDVPELNPDHVAVVAALRNLPARQREALVLHHMMDLPVTEVAEHFEVPVGTVKSWLHRGRAAIADDLRIDVAAAIATPPAAQIKRRSRARVVVATALALMMAAAGTYLALHFGPDRTAPLPPVQSPSPTPSPATLVDPADPMLTVDWKNVAIASRRVGDCRIGGMRVRPDQAAGAIQYLTPPDSSSVVARADLAHLTIGDLDADGKAEAVIPMNCYPNSAKLPEQYQLGVLRWRGDGILDLVTITTDLDRSIAKLWIYLGVVYAHTSDQRPAFGELGDLRAYRIIGGALGPTGTAPYAPLTELNLTPVAGRLACGLAPPEADLRLRFDAQLTAVAGLREFIILRPTDRPLLVERGQDRPALPGDGDRLPRAGSDRVAQHDGGLRPGGYRVAGRGGATRVVSPDG